MREFKKKKMPSRSSSDHFFAPHVQTKLAVGKPGDKFENEADTMASKVVGQSNSPDIQKTAMKEDEKVQAKPLAESISPIQKKELAEDDKAVQKAAEKKEEEKPIQKKDEEPKDDTAVQKKEEEDKPVQKAAEKKEEEKPVQKKEDEPKDDAVQKKEEEDKPVQKTAEKKEDEQPVQKSSDGQPATANKVTEKSLGSTKGKGTQMNPQLKSQMESGFGADFSDVRIHTDSKAEQMTSELGAQAFTNGKDIYFNKGKFNPDSKEGQHLIAHELTHTIQQEGMTEKPFQLKGEEETESVAPATVATSQTAKPGQNVIPAQDERNAQRRPPNCDPTFPTTIDRNMTILSTTGDILFCNTGMNVNVVIDSSGPDISEAYDVFLFRHRASGNVRLGERSGIVGTPGNFTFDQVGRGNFLLVVQLRRPVNVRNRNFHIRIN